MLTHTQKWRRLLKIAVQCGLALTVLLLFSALLPAASSVVQSKTSNSNQGITVHAPLQNVSYGGDRAYTYDGFIPTHLTQNAPAGPIQEIKVPADGLALNITMGYYQSFFRMNYWTPVHVSMTNSGPAFKGQLTVSVFTGPPNADIISITSPWSFEQAVTLRHGAQQQLTVYAPFLLTDLIPLGFVATLRDGHDKVVAIQTVMRGYSVRTGDLFIGMLSDHGIASFNALSNVVIPHQSDSLTLSPLNASTMPANVAALKAFDILILDDFNLSTLSSNQLTALQTWVGQGGVLIEVGGPHWQRTLGKLPPELLPVRLDGTRTLPANTQLLPADSKLIAAAAGDPPSSSKLATPIVASTATPITQDSFYDSKTLLSSGGTPLLVQARQGQGAICYLAFDPTADPLVSWDGAGLLWKTLLLNALGDKVLVSADTSISYDNGPGQLLTQGGIVDMIAPGRLLQPGIVFLLLLGYVLMLGPLRLLIVRGLKLPRIWTWRILALSLLVFSLLTYSAAAFQKSVQLVDNTLSLVQLTQNGSAAHVTTYHGVLLPLPGSIALHVPAQSMLLPLSSPPLARTPLPGPHDDEPASITMDARGSTVNMVESKRWTFHPMLSEEDTQLPGTLTAHLALRNNRLVGTLKNTFHTDLNDIYVLLPHSFIAIGHLGAGETLQVDLPLRNVQVSNSHDLADALAQEGNLPASYFPYTNNQQPQSDFQRHMALLSALNGAGLSVLPCSGPCNHDALTVQNSIVLPGVPSTTANLTQSYDPLLISGAPATLIGWANQQLGSDTMTINGQQPGGQHESFVRMPLNITLNNAGNIPPNFIEGTPIEAENSSAQLIQPDVYSMTGASLFFAFTLPGTQQAHGITIQMPTLPGTTSGTGDNVTLQMGLYNWQTNRWDLFTPLHNAFTVAATTPYIGSDGRLLLQVTNPSNAPAALVFGKPFLVFAR